MILFIIVVLSIVFMVVALRISDKKKRALMSDEGADPVTDELNLKVPPEKGYVRVDFGGNVIQLSVGEWLLWNTWDRKRKRQFVRDFKKVTGKK